MLRSRLSGSEPRGKVSPTPSVVRCPYQLPKEERGTFLTNPQAVTPNTPAVIVIVTQRHRPSGRSTPTYRRGRPGHAPPRPRGPPPTRRGRPPAGAARPRHA